MYMYRTNICTYMYYVIYTHNYNYVCTWIHINHDNSFIHYQPTAKHPIVVLVNNTPVIQVTKSDWPKSLWSFDLLISDRENVSIKVKLEEISFELTLKEGVLCVNLI